MLRGRDSERATLDGLLEAVGDGRSAVLVLQGDSGVGKTALLDYLVERAAGWRVARAAGVESEMELAFAGLHQLCAPLLDLADRLPAPQRDALGTAFGRSEGEAPDRFLVGLAVLSLLSEASEEQLLLCAVDDVQWLDQESAQVLAFVARRLLAEPVAMVFGTREPSEELKGLPELVVEGLRIGDARELLASAIGGPIDERVRDRVVAETRGNPLALLELPRGLTLAELAGGFGLVGAPLSGRIEESFLRRLAALPPETQRLLLIAAAEPVGDPVLVWRAAELLGIDAGAAEPAAEAGLVEFGAQVRFRHPLVRSAVYAAAPVEDRNAVHAALAEATDPAIDPDRRAWHRAQATSGPDDDVADELERSAGRAQARGGLAAAAAFLERAAELTRDPARRAERALAAARDELHVGAFDAALGLLATAEAGPPDELLRARVALLRAQIAFAMRAGRDAPPLLLAAARQLEPLDVGLARETYLDALAAALFAGRLARAGGGVLEVAEAARAAPPAPEPPRPVDLLLDGLALLLTEGYPAGAPAVKRALRAFRDGDMSRAQGLRWLWLACHAAIAMWDDEAWDELSARHVKLAREAGALTVLPMALASRTGLDMYNGQLAGAASVVEEISSITAATGVHIAPYHAIGLASRRGRETEARELIDATAKEVEPRGEGMGLAITEWADAMLYNALGRYEEALVTAWEASQHPEELWLNGVLGELVEAAARSGREELAADALERLSDLTRAAGTDWALGVEARSRALVSEGAEAERLYREAIDRLSRPRVRIELARTHLVYGEWLRRERRRLDAREQLRIADDMFTEMGVERYAQRAARELLATGETARKRTAETSDQLTAQEAQIARLARDGLSNPEIAAQLFISPRTVEYHLHKVFTKLGIASRGQLDQVLPGERDTPLPV